MHIKQRTTLKGAQGFTLVELLVVIGIIAVLIAMLLPALGRARAQANTIKCASNLRQLYTTMQIYATEYHDYFLPANSVNGYWEAGDWYGTLARLYYKADMYNSTGGYIYGSTAITALNKSAIAKYLECPSNVRPPYDPTVGLGSTGQSASPITWMYIYNRGLGDLSSLGTSPTPTQIGQYGFRKRTQVPSCVFVAADMAPFTLLGANNNRFVTFAREVNPLDPWAITNGPYVNSPHGTAGSPRVNVLLAGGQVITANQKNFNNIPAKYTIDARDWSRETQSTRQVNMNTPTTLN